VLAAVGGALTAAYFLRLLRTVTHGPAVLTFPPRVARVEWAAWSPLILLALIIGLVPALVLGATHDPIGALTEALR
jgi:NADH-quinone oxidoreductase subunit M